MYKIVSIFLNHPVFRLTTVKFYVLLAVHFDIIVRRKTNLMHNLFLVYFVNLYMFRAYLRPSSGGTNICIQQLVLIFLFRRLSVVLDGFQPGQQSVI